MHASERLARSRPGLAGRLDPQLLRVLSAIGAGVVGALAVWLFHQALEHTEILLYGHSDGLVAAARGLPAWQRIVTPVLGGLAAGTLLWLWNRTRASTPRHADDYIEAVTIGDGRLDQRGGFGKIIASFLVVVAGGAVGREGAMVLLAALTCSFIGTRVRHLVDLRLVVACGVAAGFAAAYHAPLASSLFIAEVLLGSLALAAIGPVILAAVTSALVTYALSGDGKLYQVAASAPLDATGLALVALIGVVAGVLGPLFLAWLDASRKGFARLNWPLPLQLAAGGLLVGLVSVLRPEAWGNGYSAVQAFLLAPAAWQIVTLILVCKLIAVAGSIGSGAPGGIFTPTLLVGAAFGQLAARLLAPLAPGAGHPLLFTISGMGVFLAATTHAPVMSALMVLEMTGQVQLLLALLPACVIAAGISRRLRATSVYASH
ncbi:voltage-gated ClC-type chloride channel ClcB [Jeongeupia naejangsanensis]|uniref:Voltage-gated ClC-type chloride channel ClcB n=1 Tax=Jeongeupia naejangsanensis TaxID=613195 RepID=A0ABS2BIX8_9NEIS|nr:voltage-gated ClC-type chloride channel ClcB [Jeongeupia naejangsanensis]MBM3114936.1 voltage-gated ClC-type chloride channel ClcB [Jeongeupia naejangsanensis]